MAPVSRASDPTLLRAVVTAEDPGARWDTFVAGHPCGHLMQSRAWAAVRAETGWAPFFVSLTEHEEIRAAALCLQLGIPGTGLGLLYVPRGPIVDWSDLRTVNALGDAIRQLATAQRAFLIQADPPIPESRHEVHAALERLGFRRQEKHGVFRVLQPRWVMRIPLDSYGGPEELLAALPHKTRYNIHFAERKGVQVVSRVDDGACRLFHDLLSRGARAKGYPVRGFRYHAALWRHCVQAGLGEYLFAQKDDATIAAIQVLRFGATAWYMYGASTDQDRHLMPTYLLQWTGIRRAWDAGCRCYDMRGVYSRTPQPDHPDYGVYDFKRKFNAEMVGFLGEYDLVVRPGAYRAWRILERMVQQPAAWALCLRRRVLGP
jgi:lipid II:glycine glycyltransferase (peptidoglycan interpeptide bridge formation enzyme)